MYCSYTAQQTQHKKKQIIINNVLIPRQYLGYEVTPSAEGEFHYQVNISFTGSILYSCLISASSTSTVFLRSSLLQKSRYKLSGSFEGGVIKIKRYSYYLKMSGFSGFHGRNLGLLTDGSNRLPQLSPDLPTKVDPNQWVIC